MSSGSPHPVDLLLDEHRLIRQVLGALEREATRLSGGGPLRRAFWLDAAEFVRGFAEGCHHSKEEDVLFSKLLERSRSVEVAPIAAIKHEHTESRALERRLRRGAADGDRQEVLTTARAYVGMLRRHIENEEGVLFAMARELLSPADSEEVLEGFARIDAQALAGEAHRYRRLAADLDAQAE